MSSCAHPEALVETDWVAEHASDPNVRVFAVDADTAAWEQGHIPGAVCLSWKADLQQQSVRDVVSTEQLEALLSEHGVTADTTIVVYGEARLAASFFWLLVSHGHKDIRLLNGGRVQWVAEGRPLATKVPSYGPARYVAGQRDVSVRALRDDVLDAIGAEVPIETGGPAVPRSNAVRRVLALSLVVAMTLAACGGASTSTPGAPASAAPAVSVPATKKISIAVPGPNQFMYLVFEVANGHGDYAREGLEVDITYTKSGTNAVDAVVSGSAIAGAAALDVQIGAVRQGKKLVEIMSITRQPPFALVVNPKASGTIGTVAGLKGKRIAVQNVGSGDYLLATLILAEAGLSVKDVEFLPAGNDDLKVGLMKKGDADAAMLQEPSMLQLRRDGARVLVSFFTTEDARKYLGGMYQFCGLVATQETIDKDPDTLARLVRALVAAEKFIRASRGADILKVLTDEQIVGQNRADLTEMLDLHKDQIFSPDGIMYENEMEKVVVAQKRSGVLPAEAVVDVKSLATTRFVKP